MVLEEARVTDERIEMDESSKAALNEKLNMILEFVDEQPEVSITYFEPDKKKSGYSNSALQSASSIRSKKRNSIIFPKTAFE